MNLILRRFASNIPYLPPLVTSHLLNKQQESPKFSERFRIIDATWDFASSGRDPRKEYVAKRIPGAKFFDIDECSDHLSELPHMLPTAAKFEEYVSSLGINNESHVIVYDNNEKFGLFSAPRVWWTFRVFGHDMVSVLDGGLPKWVRDGYSIESNGKDERGMNQSSLHQFKSQFRSDLVKGFDFMKRNVDSEHGVEVLDARSAGRFKGISPEARPEISSGHIPKSINVPYTELLNADDKTMKSILELKKLFLEKGVDLNQDFVATCGSGITACIIAYAAFLCTGKEVPVFDGSWVEWASKANDCIIKEK